MLQSDLLQRHQVVRQLAPPLEDRRVRPLQGSEERFEAVKPVLCISHQHLGEY